MIVAAATRGTSSLSLSGSISWADVALALCLVAVAVVVSRIRQVGLEGDLLLATFRSFAQLLAIGYVLDYVFKGHGGLTLVVLAVMVSTATFTSGRRGRRVPGHYVIWRRRSASPRRARSASSCCSASCRRRPGP